MYVAIPTMSERGLTDIRLLRQVLAPILREYLCPALPVLSRFLARLHGRIS
jgi:hypothetical protein